MKLVTIQASAVKSIFEVLKDILNDVNIYFQPDGVYIVTLDTARTSLVDMFLSADNFEECPFGRGAARLVVDDSGVVLDGIDEIADGRDGIDVGKAPVQQGRG